MSPSPGSPQAALRWVDHPHPVRGAHFVFLFRARLHLPREGALITPTRADCPSTAGRSVSAWRRAHLPPPCRAPVGGAAPSPAVPPPEGRRRAGRMSGRPAGRRRAGRAGRAAFPRFGGVPACWMIRTMAGACLDTRRAGWRSTGHCYDPFCRAARSYVGRRRMYRHRAGHARRSRSTPLPLQQHRAAAPKLRDDARRRLQHTTGSFGVRSVLTTR